MCVHIQTKIHIHINTKIQTHTQTQSFYIYTYSRISAFRVEQQGANLPDKLYIQLDNTTRQNKSQFLMVLQLLLTLSRLVFC